VRRKLRATKRPHDRGIDGECFYDDTENHRRWHVIIQVKAGSVTSGDVRDLGGTIERERRKARVDPGRGPIGVLVSTKLPTKEMRLEATLTEFLDVADDEGPIPRLQFLSVDDLFLPRIPIRILGKNNAQRPAPALPSRGQTAIVFPAKVRPAQEAKTKAKADAQAIRLFAEDQPTTKAASLDVEAEKPAKRPSSKPYGVPESPQQTVAEKGSKPPKK
jgi:hypothetical protein